MGGDPIPAYVSVPLGILFGSVFVGFFLALIYLKNLKRLIDLLRDFEGGGDCPLPREGVTKSSAAEIFHLVKTLFTGRFPECEPPLLEQMKKTRFWLWTTVLYILLDLVVVLGGIYFVMQYAVSQAS